MVLNLSRFIVRLFLIAMIFIFQIIFFAALTIATRHLSHSSLTHSRSSLRPMRNIVTKVFPLTTIHPAKLIPVSNVERNFKYILQETILADMKPTEIADPRMMIDHHAIDLFTNKKTVTIIENTFQKKLLHTANPITYKTMTWNKKLLDLFPAFTDKSLPESHRKEMMIQNLEGFARIQMHLSSWFILRDKHIPVTIIGSSAVHLFLALELTRLSYNVTLFYVDYEHEHDRFQKILTHTPFMQDPNRMKYTITQILFTSIKWNALRAELAVMLASVSVYKDEDEKIAFVKMNRLACLAVFPEADSVALTIAWIEGIGSLIDWGIMHVCKGVLKHQVKFDALVDGLKD